MKTIQISIPEKNVKVQYKVEDQYLQGEIDSLRNRCAGVITAPALVNTESGFFSIPSKFFLECETIITTK